MRIIGIDPDTKATGIALLEDGVLKSVRVARAKGRKAIDRIEEMVCALSVEGGAMPPADILVIEWQSIRPTDPRPNDIAALFAVAGAALVAFVMPIGVPKVLLPLPVQWKGSIPKESHQKRILKAANLNPHPKFDGVKDSEATHVIDAIGLAQWGLKQYTKKFTKTYNQMKDSA